MGEGLCFQVVVVAELDFVVSGFAHGEVGGEFGVGFVEGLEDEVAGVGALSVMTMRAVLTGWVVSKVSLTCVPTRASTAPSREVSEWGWRPV